MDMLSYESGTTFLSFPSLVGFCKSMSTWHLCEVHTVSQKLALMEIQESRNGFFSALVHKVSDGYIWQITLWVGAHLIMTAA